jgi:hypothetical protein
MDLYSLIVLNRELIKIFYGLIIIVICLIIVAKSHRLFKLSSYEGIRYFRNAFLFYAIAYIFRYIFGGFVVYGIINANYLNLIRIVFEFFTIIAGFFLLYSLLWKRIEGSRGNFSSILNLRILIFYVMAFIISILDYTWNTYYFMFFSQIIIFICAAIISYINYIKNGEKGRFLKFYFLAMILALVSGILNTATAIYLNWDRGVLFYVYIINIVIFLLFLYGIVRITNQPRSI